MLHFLFHLAGGPLGLVLYLTDGFFGLTPGFGTGRPAGRGF
jgi:hypothetical protein